ncbi:hypothetical protein TNCV_3231861 [Trichonephila clavipes]|nr:hypothetical protein TNCV_3231861 [Trichonephila clavipes]
MFEAIRVPLATNLASLSRGQVTRTTPELTPNTPKLHTTPKQGLCPETSALQNDTRSRKLCNIEQDIGRSSLVVMVMSSSPTCQELEY